MARFPSRVFGVGDEPDPRFTLANERTFLAWIRTALALLAGAGAINAIDLDWPQWLSGMAAAILALTGLACVLFAWLGWASVERALRLRAPLPGGRAHLVLLLGVGIVAVLVGVGSVFAELTG
ncbi:YidH family protein [Nocardioides sp. Root151]|uniref:YidH family protein n=1 Tax=Nocardioides sp. Root151 TaxID=1736475 RepID=UPI0007034E12|nr:DUF202 domain-containing protein [Nocardioides sp. Root151]KQZ70709.1 hypothetical protein ASD66_14130 [Nocardioides sp. Root151]